MRVEGEKVIFSVSDVMMYTEGPSYIVLSHLPKAGPRQLYTAFSAPGLRDLIEELQVKLEVMEA